MQSQPMPGQGQVQPSAAGRIRASVPAEDTWGQFPIDGYPTEGVVRITVTPEMAAAWLTRTRENRPLSKTWAQELARRMDLGQWWDTRDPLQFSEEGWLLNGQHRLTGVVIRDKATDLYFAFGLPNEAVGAIDTGRSRSRSDVMAIKGWDYPKLRPHAMRLLLNWEQSDDPWSMPIRKRQYGPLEIEHAMRTTYTDLSAPLEWATYMSRQSVAGGGALWAAILLRMSRLSYDSAEEFQRGVSRGSNLPADSPLLILRNQLLLLASRSMTVAQQERVAAWIIKAWNFWRAGERVKTIRWRDGREEAFPKLK